MTTSLAQTIRAKKLGVLIRDARLSSHHSMIECAEAMGVTPEQFEAYELGDKSPSLPELEMLSLYLEIPLEHFWGFQTIAEKTKAEKKFSPEQLIRLRQRVIGVMIRQARTEVGLGLEALAAKAGLEPVQLEAYELGELSIPLPALEAIAAFLSKPVRDFQDQSGPAGTWASQRRVVEEFLEMPPDLQAFVCKPINRPYLDLAQRLSEMSVDKLRAVAEGLLEITL